MGKPRLIIIIRHAQSEGNRDKTIHQTVPDHRVGLTPEGHEQACEAGEKLRQLLRNDDTLHFFISPYRRTRETTEGILSTLCANEPVPSPFQRSRIKVYEEPRLREQDFGNFQPGTEETERLWRERAAYGHFFYRIPNGESGADVYDRVSSFNGSMWRRFSEDSMASVAILVTHGLCSRIFLMVWYHYSVEFFEDLRNINHCEFLVMKLAKNGRYVLQNQLRRWSDLRRERAQRRSVAQPSPEIPVRRWGSSRSHQELAGATSSDPHRPVRQNTVDLFRDNEDDGEDGSSDVGTPSIQRQSPSREQDRRRHSHETSQGPRRDSDQTKRSASNLSSKLREFMIRGDSPEADETNEEGSPSKVRADEYSLGGGEDDDNNVHKDENDDDDDDEIEEIRVLQKGRDGGGSKSGYASPAELDELEDESTALTTSELTPRSRSRSHAHSKPGSNVSSAHPSADDLEKITSTTTATASRPRSTTPRPANASNNKDISIPAEPYPQPLQPRTAASSTTSFKLPSPSMSTSSLYQHQPRRSLAAALRGDFDHHHHHDTGNDDNLDVGNYVDDPQSRRVMADALGDQSDADVEEFDLEMGTKEKERKEMAHILREERLDRIKERRGIGGDSGGRGGY